MQIQRKKHIAFLIGSMSGGGAERVILTLATSFAEQGYQVDLLLFNERGEYLPTIPHSLRVILLESPFLMRVRNFFRMLGNRPIHKVSPSVTRQYYSPHFIDIVQACFYTLKDKCWSRTSGGLLDVRLFTRSLLLTRYVHQWNPDVLFSALNKPNLLVTLVKDKVKIQTRTIISIRAFSLSFKGELFYSFLQRLRKYPDGIVCVAQDLSKAVAKRLSISQERITTIYNPISHPDIMPLAQEVPEHPWLRDSEYPVILAVGRLTQQKDYSTLISAFASLDNRKLRLVILGKGNEREKLVSLIKTLRLEDRVCLAGWVANPYAFMRCARLFVLSSRWEGLPNVLIEAMACGCPVVSTNCPTGPREILEDGLWGELVPVGDVQALAQAIERTLSQEPDREALRRRTQFFSVERAVQQYEKMLFST